MCASALESRECATAKKEPAAAELQLRSSASGPQVRSLPSELVAERLRSEELQGELARAQVIAEALEVAREGPTDVSTRCGLFWLLERAMRVAGSTDG